jgi:hypothetical protein
MARNHSEREVYALLVSLDTEQRKRDISNLYTGRLRSHQREFEGIKRKWVEFTGGAPLPKRLKTGSGAGNDEETTTATTMGGYLENVAEEEEEMNQKIAAIKPIQQQQTVKKNAAFKPVTQPSQQQQQPPATTAATHPDDALIVQHLNYNDLRKEMKKRGLEAKGKKVELQERLVEYLEGEKLKRDEEAERSVVVTSGKKSEEEVVKEMDGVIEDVSGKMESTKLEPAEEGNCKLPAKEADVTTAAKRENNNNTVGATKQAPKSALKQSKFATNTSIFDSKPASKPADPKTLDSTTTTTTKISDSSDYSNSVTSKASITSATKPSLLSSSTKKSYVPSHAHTPASSSTSYKKSGSVGGSAKLLERKQAMDQAKEARQARLAEMRAKVSSLLPLFVELLNPFACSSPEFV